VSDAQWHTFCDAFGFADLKANPQLATNNDRVRMRPSMMPDLRARMAGYTVTEIAAIFESKGLPFAPITRPEALFDDEHLIASGGLADIVLPDGSRAGETTQTALFPFTMAGQRLGVRLNPPTKGEHTDVVLQELGVEAAEIASLRLLKAIA
jgi:crotonobetainyl-CoA:carnitine CoA-transferase CaiB-like acyl-CoA transferase